MLRPFSLCLSLSIVATTLFEPTIGSAAPVIAGSWSRFHGDSKSTGQAGVDGPQTPSVKWKIQIGTWAGSPVIGPEGTIYFVKGMHDGLVALDPDGKEKWRFKLPPSRPPSNLSALEREEWLEEGSGGSSATHAPAVGPDGTIYFGVTFHPNEPPANARLGLYAIDPGGKQKWFFSTGEEVTSSPSVGSGGAVYFSSSKALYCVASDGSLKWSVPRNGKQVKWSTPALDENGNAYVVGEALSAISPAGKILWSYFPQRGTIKGFAAHPAIGHDGVVCFAAGDIIYAVNRDGTERWVRNIGWTESGPAIGADDTIYIGTGRAKADGVARFFALDPKSGAVKWSFPITRAVDSSPAIGRDGTIYFGSDAGLFYALTNRGELKWKLDIGVAPGKYGEIDTSPAIGPDGTLYFGHAGGPGEKEGGLFFYAVGR